MLIMNMILRRIGAYILDFTTVLLFPSWLINDYIYKHDSIWRHIIPEVRKYSDSVLVDTYCIFPSALYLWPIITSLCIWLLYEVISIRVFGKTLGMYLCGIQVCSIKRKIGVLQLIAWYLLRYTFLLPTVFIYAWVLIPRIDLFSTNWSLVFVCLSIMIAVVQSIFIIKTRGQKSWQDEVVGLRMVARNGSIK